MNRLNPELKKVMNVARKAEQASSCDDGDASEPFIRRVLHQLSVVPASAREISLFETMAQRGAAFAALAGLLILSIQISTEGSSIGMLKDATASCAEIFRLFVP